MGTTGVGYAEHAPVPAEAKFNMVMSGTENSITFSCEFQQMYRMR
jgi:hypothetical protein